MYFEQFYLTCLAHASYMIGSGGEAAIIDPQRRMTAPRHRVRDLGDERDLHRAAVEWIAGQDEERRTLCPSMVQAFDRTFVPSENHRALEILAFANHRLRANIAEQMRAGAQVLPSGR